MQLFFTTITRNIIIYLCVLITLTGGACAPTGDTGSITVFAAASLREPLRESADEYEGKLTVAKVNVDENVQLPPKYGIRGIPTMLLFKDGAVQATKVGALSKANLNAFLDSNI